MECQDCGQELPDDTITCSQCGTEAEEALPQSRWGGGGGPRVLWQDWPCLRAVLEGDAWRRAHLAS